MTPVLRVGVIGAYGRMGAEVCRAVEAEDDLELIARVGRRDSMDSLSGADVAVEFSTPETVKENVLQSLQRGLDVVVGATGLSPADLTEIEAVASGSESRVLVAPNFAVGAVLMMRFAAAAAPHFDVVEIVERHHERKLDAPSGTALRTAALINEARPPVDSSQDENAAPSRGTDAGGVRIHSLRLPGSVAHQEVVLGGRGQTLTIRHDSIDRSSFMPGVLLAIRRVGDLPAPLTVGLEHLLDLGT
ncbi:MAG TPA: 4-hydroxy-tetrahydrodipicolinate reductase [Actinomycetota bacterium]|nr:4-hydroxy-tetrahydrodipicolinate reductase [Actinomycetota bacterium]